MQASTFLQRFALGLGLLIAVQSILTAYVGVFDPVYHRPTITLAAIAAAMLHWAAARSTRKPDRGAVAWLVDVALFSLVALGIWRFLVHGENAENMLVDFEVSDQLMALGAILALIEISRREFGWGLSGFAALILVYCLFGQKLPAWLGHAGFSLDQTMQGMWFGFQGVFGMPVAILLEVLFIYIIFGVVLEATGAGNALIRISIAAVGRITGGSAHAAIVASGLFGTISGSVVANVVGTGTFTIPLIKRQGFSPAFAGAVEAAASSGGQIMPPVMGAAAFLMAQLTGYSYLTICLAALIPALIYYGSLFVAVYFEAKKLGIRPLAPEEMPKLGREDWLHALMFAGPIAMILGIMLAGRSPAMAGFFATMTALVLGFINKDVRARPHILVEALAKGGINCARILVAVGAIGIVIAGLNLTGLGLAFAQAVLSITGQSLLLGLMMTALACIVLGTGLPTLPSYLIIVLVMGPAMTKIGVPLLAIHMFVFYYGIISHLTPPVAMAAMAAAPIAGANPIAVALVGTRLALIKYLLPFVFVYTPSLLLVINFDWGELIWGLVRMSVATLVVTSALAGFDRRPLHWVEVGARLVGGGLALLDIVPVATAGVALSLAALVGHRIFGRPTTTVLTASQALEKEQT